VYIGRHVVHGEEHADLTAQVDARAIRDGAQQLRKALGWVAAGIALLVIGGEVLVRGASELARALGASERVIALTIIAIGTGAPDAATSIVAARRGESEIALGNVIGSNLFNIAGILGITSLIAPTVVHPAIVNGDLLWMIALSAVLLPMMWGRLTVSRMEGGLLLGAYGTYLALLVFGA
jgi:cation:H+ antiporter